MTRTFTTLQKTISIFGVLCAVLFLLSFVLVGCQSSPEKKKLKHYNKGIEYLQKDDIESALIAFKNAIEVDSSFADAYYQLGLAYQKIREFDKAVIAFGNAASNDPKNVDARLQVANYYASHQRDFQKAREELEKILQDFPQNAQAYASLGSVHYAQENIDAATAALRKSLELEPDLIPSGIMLGRIYLRQKPPEVENARQVFQKLVQQNPKHINALLAMATFYLEAEQPDSAKEYYLKASTLDNQNVSVHLGLAEVYIAQNLADKAIAQIDLLKKTSTEEFSREQNLRMRLIKGRAYLLKEEYGQAVSQLQNVTDYLPGLLIGQFSFGLAQAGVGNFEQAILAYKKALEISQSTHVPSLVNLAIVYFKAGQEDDALEYVQRTLKRAPNNAEAHDLLGMIFVRQGEHEKALEQFSLAAQFAQKAQLSKKFSNQVRLHRMMSLLNSGKTDEAIMEIRNAIHEGHDEVELYAYLAKAYLNKGSLQDAIQYYQQTIEKDPEYLNAYVGLANIYATTEQYELAQKTLAPILPKYAETPEVRYILGRIYAGGRHFKEAKEELEKAIQARPRFVDAHYTLAIVYRALNDVEGAIQEYETVLNIFPAHVPSLANLAHIKLLRGHYEEAVMYANQALRHAPENVTILGIVSSVYARLGQFDKAIEIIEKLQEQHADSPALYISLGIMHLNKQEYDLAIEHSQKAIDLNAEDPVPYDTIGRAYLGKEEFERAEEFFRKALRTDPKFADSYVKLGQITSFRKKYFEAIRYLEKALEIRPDSDEAMFELGKIYHIQHRDTEAITTFEQVKESSRFFEPALEQLVALYNQQEDYNKVISRAAKLLKIDEKNVKAHYLLGHAYAKRGNSGNAANVFRELTLFVPDFKKAQIDLGYLYLVQNRSDDALLQFQEVRDALQKDQENTQLALDAAIGTAITHQLLQEYPKAIETVLAILEEAPDNQAARFVLGNIYISQKSFSDAVRQFRQMKNPVLESQAEELDLRTYYGDQSAVAAAYYNLGLLCVSKRWFTFAKEAFKTALWRTPDNPLLHYAIGNVYFLMDSYENTVKSFEKVLKREPKFISVYKMLGNMYRKQQHFDRAIIQYQTYLRNNPDDVVTLALLGMMYEKHGQVDNAIAEYQKVVEMDTKNPLVFNQLAWVYAEQETQLDEALELVQKAVSLSPSAGFIDTLGWVYYKRQEYFKAIEQFRRALEMAPFHPMITYHLGLAHYRSGDHEIAKQLFEQVLELSENFEHAEKVRKIIGEL